MFNKIVVSDESFVYKGKTYLWEDVLRYRIYSHPFFMQQRRSNSVPHLDLFLSDGKCLKILFEYQLVYDDSMSDFYKNGDTVALVELIKSRNKNAKAVTITEKEQKLAITIASLQAIGFFIIFSNGSFYNFDYAFKILISTTIIGILIGCIWILLSSKQKHKRSDKLINSGSVRDKLLK